MIEIINSVENALEKECYLPALALALTLPDICGEIEYPELVNKKGDRLVGKQYKKWFHEWVEHYYANDEGWVENGKYAKNPYFTAKMCYELRCTYLHSGNADINDFGDSEDEEWKYDYSFELCTTGANKYGESWDISQEINKKIKERNVRININDLCYYLYMSARKYYDCNEEKIIEKSFIKTRDISSEYEYILKLNNNNR